MFSTKIIQQFPRYHWKGLYAPFTSIPNLPACEFVPPKYNGPSYASILNTRKTRLNLCLTTFYRKPLLLAAGHMQWLFDDKGNRYLDMFGGIVTVSVGHCHPKVTKAATEQLNLLGHTTNIYLHPKIHEYAERLTDKLPGDLKVVYFVNSGSEANDLATLLAKTYTKNHEMISLRNGYHGMNYQTMGLCATNTYKYHVTPSSGIHHAMNPDVYKGVWGGKYCRDSPVQTLRNCNCTNAACCEAATQYYNQFEEIFKYSLPKGHIAAFFAESIQGVGGAVQYPKGFIKNAANLVRKNGGLYIADEVQTGFGRTGEHFWGFEMHDVVPDIVTMAKGIGNGFPLGAVVTTPEIASGLTSAAHFNTFGGNPVATAVGLAVLDVIDEEKCQQRSQDVGTYLLLELSRLRDEFECVGDVRGKGLMIGVEMVTNRETRAPMQPDHFMDIWETCRDHRLLVGRGGLFGNIFRIKPPMCITKTDVDYSVAVLRFAIEKHVKYNS